MNQVKKNNINSRQPTYASPVKITFGNTNNNNKQSFNTNIITSLNIPNKEQPIQNSQCTTCNRYIQESNKLRSQISSLKSEITNVQSTFGDLLEKETKKKQAEIVKMYKTKLQQIYNDYQTKLQDLEMTVHENKLYEHQLSQANQNIQTYQDFIKNLNVSKQNLEKQNIELRNSKAEMQGQIRQLQEQKKNLQQAVLNLQRNEQKYYSESNISKQRNNINNINNDNISFWDNITLNTNNMLNIQNNMNAKNQFFYMRQLQANNLLLQKENKKLNDIILHRIKYMSPAS